MRDSIPCMGHTCMSKRNCTLFTITSKYNLYLCTIITASANIYNQSSKSLKERDRSNLCHSEYIFAYQVVVHNATLWVKYSNFRIDIYLKTAIEIIMYCPHLPITQL